MTWEDQPTADRVRWVAESLGDPRTAHWVSEQARVSPATARKYLETLAEDRRLKRIDDGERTLYYPDRITQYLDEVRELYEDRTADELAGTLRTIRDQIDLWEAEYGVSTPNDLRASISDVDRAEAERRREIAIEWEGIESRVRVIEDALNLYDRFPDDPRALA